MALAVAAGWFGWAAWRAHLQIVTLDVHNAPVAEALRKVERQTWRSIYGDNALDARITLHVVDLPLAKVLDRIAEQAGAHWSTVYAVYTSEPAIKALGLALQGDGKIESAGWAKIAPNPPPLDDSNQDDHPFIRQFGAKPDGPAPPGPKPMGMMVRRTPNGAMIIENGNGQTEIWSPEELVIESPLAARLGNERNETATPAVAADTARQVRGRWTTLLSMRKSSMGMGFAGMSGRPGGDPLKHSQTDRFARLTPEQRVQRARERMKPMSMNEEETVAAPKSISQ